MTAVVLKRGNKMKKKEKHGLILRISIDRKLCLSGKIINKSKRTQYFLYNRCEEFNNPPHLFLIGHDGKKIRLKKVAQAPIKIKPRGNPPAFTKIGPNKSISFFKSKFVVVGSEESGYKYCPEDYKRNKIPIAESYEIFLTKTLAGILPGKYVAYIVWESKVNEWCDDKTDSVKKQENVYLGKIKSNIISITLPGIDQTN